MADSSTANSTLSNPAPSAARPTDTIHDAFDAMLWFLACLIGPLRPRKITPAEEIGALAACEVETDFEPDDPPAPLLALRDLVTRAAEEHNRRALDDWHVREEAKLVRADWTPERIRETRERCERATPGPWEAANLFGKLSIVRPERRFDPQGAIAGHYGVGEHDAAFIAHAREDFPAALAEIERQARAAIVLTADAAALRSELAAAREEIERLNRLVVATANADPSWVERCTTQAAEIERLTAELAVRAPADRPEVDAEDLWTDYRTDAEIDARLLKASDRRTFLAGVAAGRRTADASRPGLTEDQARRWGTALAEKTEGEPFGEVTIQNGWALHAASRGETGPAADQVAPLPDSWRCEECKETFARCTCKHGDPEHSSNLGPGIDGAPIRIRPTALPDPRATLHAGDPAAVQYCACGAAVSPGEDHPTGPRHDVARRPQ